MVRKLIIFGNGIGRALNPEKYDLAAALVSAWQDENILSPEQKSLIHQCLPIGVLDEVTDHPPTSEDELDALQKVVMACDEIQQYQSLDGADWLTSHGKAFPTAIRRFIHGAACHFHEGADVLPSNFMQPLRAHILASRSHVATLNYDELLYRSFVGTGVFNGYNCLIDGFRNGIFDSSHLDRFYPQSTSYYLHLHGSPLYLTDIERQVRKYSMSQISSIKGTSSIHLVLAHINHKVDIIKSSEVLNEYWRRLEVAMSEVNDLLLVGYGGGDTHLNKLIKQNFSGSDKQVLIVQYHKESLENKRDEKFSFWRSKLGSEVKHAIYFRENLLSFSQWDDVFDFDKP